MLFNKEGSVLAINEAFTACFGYTIDDVKGAYLSVFFTEEDRRKGKPENEIREVIEKGQCNDNNYLVGKDATFTWVSGESVKVVGDNNDVLILKVIQNIHKQKTSEESLQKLNQFNENILASIADAVVVLDEDLNIVSGNRAFYNLFRPGTETTSQIHFPDIIRDCDNCDTVLANLTEAVQHERVFSNIAITIKNADGETMVCDVSCNGLRDQPDSNHVLVVMHDITNHKRIEREREDVIGYVAHELKNPLANLGLVHELLSDVVTSGNVEDLKFLLEKNKKNISRLNRMISELYDATRVNAGIMKLEYSVFRFDEMIEEAIETTRAQHSSHEITLDGIGNFQVEADRHRLIQVVTNLLSNAMKYSPSETTVSIRMGRDDKNALLSVKDEGMGIQPNQMPYIFDRFFRVDKSKHLEGIGMGLFLCRQIVIAHGGKIWAESEEGAGSAFHCSIPITNGTVKSL